ncbi:MAG TPA: chemotaxis protein CheB, partial [Desulfuromonadaceae bacterium]
MKKRNDHTPPHGKGTAGRKRGKAPIPPGGGKTPVPARPCFVVGIGASAGGQEALEQIFTTLPVDCGLAYVVVMHLPPDGPSFLTAMLSRYTTMPVVTAEEGMPLLPDRVHVIPAGRILALTGDQLHLEAWGGAPGAAHPIDRLFGSFAEGVHERAVAVVLSGSGNDGAQGARLVKEAGGIVIVQEPGTAAYPGMPGSAIATGAADLVLAVEEIAVKIAEIARGHCSLGSRACRVTTLDEDLSVIYSIVKDSTGHDFSSYKSNTVMRRIERRMAVNDAAGIGRYIDLLRENSQEAHALCQDILIGVTSFFRDPEAFTTLRREVFPRLFANRSSDEPVRIWHACCASGEEVYSMAMLIREYLAEQNLTVDVLIFATDIDEVAISQARAGQYGDDIETEVGAERLKTFFTRNDGRWQVSKQLRDMIVFAHHSLIKAPPFSRLDLLVCRNFLIYLNPDMQQRLLALFHLVLKPGGTLFLGSAETVGRNPTLFAAIDKKWKIFERRQGERRSTAHFPLASAIRKLPGTLRSQRPHTAPEAGPGEIAEKLLLERYSPPCVVVNEKYEVVHVSTRMKRFLEVPPGEPTRDILRMACEELRPALRAAIHKSFSVRKRVDFAGVKLAADGLELTVNVVVEPLDGHQATGRLVMVVFEQVIAQPPVSATADANTITSGDDASRDMLVRQLEEQLRVTHEQLQATAEQLETSHEGFLSTNEELMSINEEFQSANEELQSTNEELETSKEELQALNEELSTVNAELQSKVEELNQANSDMENLLTSSEIATLFLDRQLDIKGFTPAAAAIFNLIRADIGRPFQHFAGKIDWPGFARDAALVLAGHPFAERQVSSLDRERHYLKRIFPYRNTDGGIDGIVVIFIDITEHKRAEEALQLSEQRYHSLFDNMLEGLAYCKMLYDDQGTPEDFVYLEVNNAFGRLTGLEHVVGKRVTEVIPGIRESAPELFEIYGRVALTGRSEKFEIEFKPLSAWLSVSVYSMDREYFVAVFDDITERKRTQEALAESEAQVRRKLDSIISPEGDIGNLELEDVIDAPVIQSLVDDFHKLVPIPMAIIDLQGKVLVGKGWQDVCTQFHRVHPETSANCHESDLQLTAGIPAGEYKLYKCKNNMWDVATPIMVGGRHLGNFFSGQFFFDDEPLDYAFFKSQARCYGFNEDEYIAALQRVPRLSRESLSAAMEYFTKFANLISQLSYSNIKLARSLVERDNLMEELLRQSVELQASRVKAENERRLLAAVMEALPVGVVITDVGGEPVQSNSAFDLIWGGVGPMTRSAEGQIEYKAWWADTGKPVAPGEWASAIAVREGETTIGQVMRIQRFDGSEAAIINSASPVHDAAGTIIGCVVAIQDITDLKRADEALRRAHDELDRRVRERTEELAATVDTLRNEIAERERMEASLLRLHRLYAVMGEIDQA